MSRRLATFVGIRSIPIAVVLVVAVACSSPKREIGSDASIAKEPAASTTSATAKPSSPAVAPAAVASAQATDNAPTPAETPLPSVSQPAARTSEPKSPPSDPLKEVQESEARRVEYQRGLVQLAADLEAARALVARSQRDLLAFKNPYLARSYTLIAENGRDAYYTGDIAEKFVALSDKVVATNLVEAKKQGAVIAYGDFITIGINFVIVAFVMFLVVNAINKA